MDTPHIELIARGVLLHNDAVLLCQNRKHGHLFLPGGHIDFNESAGSALLREVREEMGIELELGRLIGVFESAFDQPRKHGEGSRRHHEINLNFQLLPPLLSSSFDPSGITSQEDHIQFVWAPANQIGPGKTYPLLPHGIELLIQSILPANETNPSHPIILGHFA